MINFYLAEKFKRWELAMLNFIGLLNTVVISVVSFIFTSVVEFRYKYSLIINLSQNIFDMQITNIKPIGQFLDKLKQDV